jgi:phosphoribosyl-AMP cyclohydrolase
MIEIKYDDNNLAPAVVQDAQTGEVLMVAWMNAEAVRRSLQTGLAHFWSRSRGALWLKGATSGNYLHIQEIRLDCDGDTLLLRVHPDGPACHTGERSCFFTPLEAADVG